MNMSVLRRIVLAVLFATAGLIEGRADDFNILSINKTGSLTFNEISTAKTYRVEWAPQLGSSWSNFTDKAISLNEIVARGAGIVTCSVPMDAGAKFFRVLATVTNALSPASQMVMVLIPAGINSGTNPDNQTYYSLTNSTPFYMGKYEVTKSDWDDVYAWALTHGYVFDNAGSGKAYNHPVHTINWYDAVKWCNALSEKEGLAPAYTVTGTVFRTGNPLSVTLSSTAGYRLPSFTERQYAVRGGLAGKRFPWGDTIQHAQANYWSTNTYSYDISPTRGHHPSFNDGVEPYTAPVGSFPENGYGLCDMIGNVQEFCFDWATYYSIFYGKVNGGGWNTDSHICKIIVMVQWTATASAANVGFRIVRTAPQ